MPLEFPNTHPVEVTGRLLMASILKHHDLGHAALALVEHGGQGEGMLHGRHGSLPKSIADVCRVVYQAKRSLIKVWESTILKVHSYSAATQLCYQYINRVYTAAQRNSLKHIK